MQGRVVEKAQNVGGHVLRLRTDYATNGRVDRHVLSSGAVVGYRYGADGRVLTITVNGVDVVREVESFAFGELKGFRYNAADRYVRGFDPDGRIAVDSDPSRYANLVQVGTAI